MNIDGIDTIQLCCLMRQRLERAARTEYLEIPLDILARIEDDVLVTEGEPDVLTAAIPKEADAVEACVGRLLAAGAAR